jgi:cytochrome c oxidase subunit 4
MDDQGLEASQATHASVKTYLLVAVILTVVTAIEVGTYYTPWFQVNFWPLFWVLVILSVFKFALVVGFYMHLRYEALFYRRVFVFPLVLAVAMTVLLATLTAARWLLWT